MPDNAEGDVLVAFSREPEGIPGHKDRDTGARTRTSFLPIPLTSRIAQHMLQSRKNKAS